MYLGPYAMKCYEMQSNTVQYSPVLNSQWQTRLKRMGRLDSDWRHLSLPSFILLAADPGL